MDWQKIPWYNILKYVDDIVYLNINKQIRNLYINEIENRSNESIYDLSKYYSKSQIMICMIKYKNDMYKNRYFIRYVSKNGYINIIEFWLYKHYKNVNIVNEIYLSAIKGNFYNIIYKCKWHIDILNNDKLLRRVGFNLGKYSNLEFIYKIDGPHHKIPELEENEEYTDYDEYIYRQLCKKYNRPNKIDGPHHKNSELEENEEHIDYDEYIYSQLCKKYNHPNILNNTDDETYNSRTNMDNEQLNNEINISNAQYNSDENNFNLKRYLNFWNSVALGTIYKNKFDILIYSINRGANNYNDMIVHSIICNNYEQLSKIIEIDINLIDVNIITTKLLNYRFDKPGQYIHILNKINIMIILPMTMECNCMNTYNYIKQEYNSNDVLKNILIKNVDNKFITLIPDTTYLGRWNKKIENMVSEPYIPIKIDDAFRSVISREYIYMYMFYHCNDTMVYSKYCI